MTSVYTLSMWTADTSTLIKQKIIAVLAAGQWSEGECISEARIARMYGVSRTPVRQAIGQLVALGVLEQASNQAPRVRKLSAKALSDLYSMRIELEGFAAHCAARTATQSQCKTLLDAAQGFNKLLESLPSGRVVFDLNLFDRLIKVEKSYHQILNRIANNTWLEQIFEQTDLVSLVFLQVHEFVLGHPAKQQIRLSYQRHLRLAKLIELGKAGTARQYITCQLTVARERMIQKYQRDNPLSDGLSLCFLNNAFFAMSHCEV